jgi:hypothetical protein
MDIEAKALLENIDHLNDRDRTFALNLLNQFHNRGLSHKQLYWLGVLHKRATGQDDPQPAPVNVGDVSGIVALLEKAGSRLKFPAFVVSMPDGADVRISVAGAKSKVPGAINVTSLGSFENRTWYGRITRDGVFEPSRKVSIDTITEVAMALVTMAKDPTGTAAAYGKRTGNCCFCSRGLKDERSVHVGYGPICADHYGLRWG